MLRLADLLVVVADEQAAFAFLLEHGALKATAVCPRCNTDTDGLRWRVDTAACESCVDVRAEKNGHCEMEAS